VDQALAAVEQHARCTADADCVSIEVGAACFDICTRAVNQAEVNAVNAALASADCTQFLAAGCSVVPPPCAPPLAPRCNQGHCE
jgi:hypothetical protein